jgi:hypothetical protein
MGSFASFWQYSRWRPAALDEAWYQGKYKLTGGLVESKPEKRNVTGGTGAVLRENARKPGIAPGFMFESP